jgi:hypothetical protein
MPLFEIDILDLKHLQDEIEKARTAAINHEIKRVLTEVLLKVIYLHGCYSTRFNRPFTSNLRNTTIIPFSYFCFFFVISRLRMIFLMRLRRKL